MSRHVRPYAQCDRCNAEETVGKHGSLPQYWAQVTVTTTTELQLPELCMDLCSGCLAELREYKRAGKKREGYRGGRIGIEGYMDGERVV